MATYVILSKFSAESFGKPDELRDVAQAISRKIKAECPTVRWGDSYAVMGRYDVIDIVAADNPADVEKVAMIIRSFGHATTETMHATPWNEFLTSL
jgi:uncharacterized protein with GYD domain